MNSDRKILNREGKVSFKETEDDDLFYWSDKTVKQRLEELYEWNKKIWIKINGEYPAKIVKEGGKVLKLNIDEDDF
ncbi:MAG: hypothetical protein K2X48_03720 [Chitinophagaceae bacterium]|nr:hypothetical protein [Chitinophagaceae bacterium]